MITRVAIVLSSLVVTGSASGAGLRACIPDYQSPPFTSPVGEAPIQRMLSIAVHRLGGSIEFQTAPWARCVAGIGIGFYDLIVGIEADQDLLATVAFPEKSGRPDASRRLGTVEYVLVQKSGAVLTIDADGFSQLKQPILVPTSGYQSMRRLQSSGAATKAMNYDAGRFLSMLCHDRAELIVLRRRDFNPALSSCRPTRTLLLQTYSFVTSDVFLGVRRSLLTTQPELGESIWRELDRLKASPDWPVEMMNTPQAR